MTMMMMKGFQAGRQLGYLLNSFTARNWCRQTYEMSNPSRVDLAVNIA